MAGGMGDIQDKHLMKTPGERVGQALDEAATPAGRDGVRTG